MKRICGIVYNSTEGQGSGVCWRDSGCTVAGGNCSLCCNVWSEGEGRGHGGSGRKGCGWNGGVHIFNWLVRELIFNIVEVDS